jgi:hypothetical protein
MEFDVVNKIIQDGGCPFIPRIRKGQMRFRDGEDSVFYFLKT